MSFLYSSEKLIGIQEAEKISIEETPEKTVIHNCIIADPLNKRVLDILPRINGWYLTSYFMKMSKEYRDRVSIFRSDMWQPYQQTARDIFCNARRVIDKYHWAS